SSCPSRGRCTPRGHEGSSGSARRRARGGWPGPQATVAACQSALRSRTAFRPFVRGPSGRPPRCATALCRVDVVRRVEDGLCLLGGEVLGVRTSGGRSRGGAVALGRRGAGELASEYALFPGEEGVEAVGASDGAGEALALGHVVR